MSEAADHKPNAAAGDCNTNGPSTSKTARTPSAPEPAASNSSLSKPSSRRKPRKRAKVSFSQEVISKDNSGDGNKVDIKEEHGVFLGPLLGRMVLSSASQDTEGTAANNNMKEDASSSASSFSGPMISFANESHTNEKISYSESPHGILKSPYNSGSRDNEHPLGGDSNVEYDNLVVRMGLLKCGHRYRVVVPVPDHWKQKHNKDDATASTADAAAVADSPSKKEEGAEEQEVFQNNNMQQSSFQREHELYDMDVRIVEDSLDGDLRGEIQTDHVLTSSDYESSSSSPSATDTSSSYSRQEHYVCITLSGRRRGPYRGRFVLELTRRRRPGGVMESQQTTTVSSPPPTAVTESNSNNQGEISSATTTTSTETTRNKTCLMSLQVDATIMGKDMGTPKLRNGVTCMGKMVGYDSDEETEWQGFD
ncbi:hypothetical protein ACHAXR_002139 [Thalassiosira sp. AJA248-18]